MFTIDLEPYFKSLFEKGFVYFPSVSDCEWRQDVYANCLKEINTRSYAENLPANLNFVEHTGISRILAPALVKKAKEYFRISCEVDDIYNVCRLVRPGDTSEGYRGHFDSHLFTLVTPINIPEYPETDDIGQLHFFPNTRKMPKYEVQNIAGKIAYKRYNSKTGFEALANKTNRMTETFRDYRPLLFVGNTTFHGNSPVNSGSKFNRMTILTHFFDPSPKYGVGNLMRLIRKR